MPSPLSPYVTLAIGHLTGETRKGGDALNALTDQLPDDTVLAITLVITPPDTLEAHLNDLQKKAVGDNQTSVLTQEAIQHARHLIGRKHKLYKGSGQHEAELTQRCMNLTNILLGAGMEPVQPDDEVAGLSTHEIAGRRVAEFFSESPAIRGQVVTFK